MRFLLEQSEREFGGRLNVSVMAEPPCRYDCMIEDDPVHGWSVYAIDEHSGFTVDQGLPSRGEAIDVAIDFLRRNCDTK